MNLSSKTVDLVGRLRVIASHRDIPRVAEAAAIIEAQARQIAKLQLGLKPFADAAEDLDEKHRDNSPIWESGAAMSINAAHLRDAARLLSPPIGEGDDRPKGESE